jgi:hypothetical protein
MLSHPMPEESADARALRGRIFTDLDRLAFALEMEAAELLQADQEEAADARQHLRLGVRLAQRLVAGVWADEVDGRIEERKAEYEARLGKVA